MSEMTPEEIKAEIKSINEKIDRPNDVGCCRHKERSDEKDE
jgi:hypothetical protein